MATIPAPEESARQILSIFVYHYKCRPGNAIGSHNVGGVWSDRGLHTDDLNKGLNYALERGWVKIRDEHTYVLTQAGFDEA